MKKNTKRSGLKEKEVTDLKIKKLTIRSGVKAAAGCNPCHTPGHLASTTRLSTVSLPAMPTLNFIGIIK